MAWRVEFERSAERELSKLDRQTRERVLRFLHQRLRVREDPRELGDRLAGPMSEFWKYRVGDYRIVAELHDAEKLILVVRVRHRSVVYR